MMGKFLRSLLLIAICFMLAAPRPSLASVGVQSDSGTLHQATNINILGASVTPQSDDPATVDVSIVSSDLVAMGIDESGATTLATLHISIPTTFAVINMVIATRTAVLDDGTQGQVIILRGIERIGGTLTVRAKTFTGWSTITYDISGEITTLLWVDDALGWMIIGATGATVTVQN